MTSGVLGVAEVTVEGLRVRYGPVTALDEVSLKAKPGELVALLGPSGCGKTTLLRAVAGFVEPEAGEIWIGGERCAGVPPHARNIGMVFQDYALFPHLTVEGNITYGLRMRRVSPASRRDRIAECITLLGLEGLEGRYPTQLSGGQQQRVALARALAIRPRVLLLDEPFGALDRKLREQMQVEVRALQRRVGITTLFVTHDQEEALALADQVVVMDRGRVEQAGSPLEVYEHPRTPFVATFVGKSNVFTGKFVGTVAEGVMVALDPDGTPALLPQGPAASSRVTFVVRSERLRLKAPGAERGPNRCPGVIETVVYLGVLTEVRVRLATGRILSVVETTRPQSVNEPPWREGQPVDVYWEPDDVRLLEDSSASQGEARQDGPHA